MMVSHPFVLVLVVYLHSILVNAGNLVSQEPLLLKDPKEDTGVRRERIAIIGAGAGGSSAAYHLQKYTSHSYDIHIFEKNEYIGGRSTTIGNYDPLNFPGVDIELGGSVFVPANKILYNAAKEFNLTLVEKDLQERYPDKLNGSVGIWNGTSFVFSTDSTVGPVKLALKLLWRHGYSLIKAYLLVKKTVGTFIDQYYYVGFPFTSLTEKTIETGLNEVTGTPGLEYLKNAGIKDGLLFELIEPATRVNYRSNLNDIHGLEALVSIAADDGTTSVEGGNYLIFENFIKSSNAVTHLGTSVNSIVEQPNGKWSIGIENKTIEDFDHVIIASPFFQADIQIETNDQSLKSKLGSIKTVEYRDLYVTYIKTKRNKPVNHLYFGLGVDIPESILTTTGSSDDINLPFFSVSVVHYDNSTDELIYKIFSPDAITPKVLNTYLFDDLTDVSIYFTKLWKPYPHLNPVVKFDDFEIGSNLWYLNSIEEFISTMETSALAGANVAGLISLGKNTTEISLPN